MHYNKQCSKLIKNKLCEKGGANSTATEKNTIHEPIGNLSAGVNPNDENTFTKHHKATDIRTYNVEKRCTSSKDSLVNVSDNDEITPSPTFSYFNLFFTPTISNKLKQIFQHNNKSINLDSTINSNKQIIKVNNLKKNNFNADSANYYHDNHYDKHAGDLDQEDNSRNTDNEFKGEQCRRPIQILDVKNRSINGSNTRYQPNNNPAKSEYFINKFDVRNVETPILTAPAPDNELLSQHNEHIIRTSRRSPSRKSPLLMTSITDSYDYNRPSKMHHPCTISPVVSEGSIDSTIVIPDSDSDCDFSCKIESVHKNYVIKKLGTEITYPPTHTVISNMNSGNVVLNRKILQNAEQAEISSLETLTAISDCIEAAQALSPVPSYSGVTQRPKIGSIALSNSSDITFGDKHFYEGPVTIQQFLIDGRDKKNRDVEDNSAFTSDDTETNTNTKEVISSDEHQKQLCNCIGKRKKLIFPAVLATMALLIVATIIGNNALKDIKSKLLIGNSEESRTSIPINSTIAQDNIGGGYVLRIVPRDGWLAQPPLNTWVHLKLPIKRVIVIPTSTSECETQAACTYTVRITQTFNIESQQQDDIIYNFLVGGDGNVYEGRGWDNRGSVLKGFNDNSITFAYIGSFKKQPPSYKQLNVTKLLLQEGLRLKKLSSNYRLVAANKIDPTSVATIGDALYKSFENWPHWSTK